MLSFSSGFSFLLIIGLSLSSNEVCYDDLGCFETADVWFHPVLRPVPPPEHPKEMATSFHYYDAFRTIENLIIISWPKLEGLNNLSVDRNRPLYVITHGFTSNDHVDWMQNLRETFSDKLKGQVILVDWRLGAGKNYLQSASNTRTVGAEIARLLKAINEMGYPYEEMHLIGHSLGAHVSAYACKNISNKRIGRLTGLDPAQPCFGGLDSKVRISKGDAQFVDIIHTSSRPFLLTLGMSLIEAVGDVDFFFNGGACQPGCLDMYHDIKEIGMSITSLADLANVAVGTLNKLMSCSHGRANEYFAESIKPNNSCHFWGKIGLAKSVYEDVKKARFALRKALTPVGFWPIKNLINFGAPLRNKLRGNAETVINLVSSAPKILPFSCSKDTCTVLGLDTFKFTTRGSVFVKTRERSPYCISNREAETTLGRYLGSSEK